MKIRISKIKKNDRVYLKINLEKIDKKKHRNIMRTAIINAVSFGKVITLKGGSLY